jgi:hypothetical protein
VLAVEKLGTERCTTYFLIQPDIENPSVLFLTTRAISCRWRDVKLRAFDNAKHQTYVDLKVLTVTYFSLTL